MILPGIQIKLLIVAGLALLLIIGIGLGYRSAYNHGKLSAQEVCIKNMQAYQNEVKAKIVIIEANLTEIASITNNREKALGKDITKILEGVKKEPVVVIKEGVCAPSKNFIEGINQAIDRANEE